MTIQVAAGILAGLMAFIAEGAYIRDILRGAVQPEKWSFVIWTLLSGIFTVGLISEGGGWAAVNPAVTFIGLAIITGLAFRVGHGDMDRFHQVTLIAVGLGFTAWVSTDNVLTAVAVAVAVDFAATILVIKKLHDHPNSETMFPWALDAAAAVVTFAAVPPDAGRAFAYPAWVLFTLVLVMAAISRTNR